MKKILMIIMVATLSSCHDKPISAIGHPSGFVNFITVYSGGKIVSRDTIKSEGEGDLAYFTQPETKYIKKDTLISVYESSIVKTIPND